MGGTGGASIPFLNDAPTGSSTVSTTDVVEIRTGSPMADFLIDILRWRAALTLAPARRFGVLDEKDAAVGVDEDECGGVAFAKTGGHVPRRLCQES